MKNNKILEKVNQLNFCSDSFEHRHIGPNEQETNEMLQYIGVSSLEELIDQTIPREIRLNKPLQLPAAISEQECLNLLREKARKNKVFKSYIGLGYYGTHTPSVILRNIFENPGWYTQYTPYQAEISQGRLEALLNFQTMVADLTGLPIANASLLDEATAAAEAMLMIYHESTRKEMTDAKVFFVDEQCFPQTIDVLKTRSEPLGITLCIGHYEDFTFSERVFGAIVQYPAANGSVRDYRNFIEAAHRAGAYVVMATDLLALTLLTPPGELDADVAVGSAQRFGVPMGYGGPHAAFFATREEFKRALPGRIIGVSVDSQNKKALRMALQTREQHIRREKATSNICTAQALLAIMSSMYAVYHGPQGLKKIAQQVHQLATTLEHQLAQLGFEQLNPHFFDTLQIHLPSGESNQLKQIAEKHLVNFRYDRNKVFIALDETTLATDVELIIDIFSHFKNQTYSFSSVNLVEKKWRLPESLRRKSSFLTHQVFQRYHSETKMMRYIKYLENKDLSLTHSMIPLGSCTMKLNAVTELMPLSWPEFSQLHPFAPTDQAVGYLEIIKALECYLAEITGMAATSLQPNSGAQGEYTGLLVIRAYQKAIGQGHRNVALIPSSAHGTNPASAVMAGMKVVVVKCDKKGNIDIDDLTAKATHHHKELSCLMITYPSTHGVFETDIQKICRIIHELGGQVYMDGANMNAQVGLTSPAAIGADVCHLNLHKTFAIPHGGGGPGMGPICVAAHLAPFLPGHPLIKTGGTQAIHAVSAAPWGSASILLISYAYIRMLGPEGLANASRYAILNANYMKSRLEKAYKILYTGQNHRVAHELIIDFRDLKFSAGIDVEDVAKRLMDYGFHAPTISFPVAGTMMIEPTESEDKAELDRFCDALLQIREEIAEIQKGIYPADDNVLKNAPHTHQTLLSEPWTHKYSREKAAYPLHFVRQNKFWPSVGRVNNSYGDRNLICVCPPIEEYVGNELAAK